MTSTEPQPAAKPDSTAIPVQLSAAEFAQFILPHLSLPKRGPQCKIGYSGHKHQKGEQVSAVVDNHG